MPLIVGLSVPLAVIAGALVVLGLHVAAPDWLASLGRGNSRLAKVLGLVGGVAGALAPSFARQVRDVRAALSRFAAARLGSLTAFLNALASLWLGPLLGLLGLSGAVALALERLRAHTIPAEAKRAAQPATQQAKRAAKTATTARTRVVRVERVLQPRVIRTERVVVRQNTPALARLRALVMTVVLPRLNAIAADVGALGRTAVRPLRVRLTRLEKLMAGLLAGGLLVRALAKRFPWLFCRRLRRKIGPRACAIDDELLDSLIMDTLYLAGAISVVGWARQLQGLTRPVAEAVNGLLVERMQ